jgi:hypothetical protein
MTDNKKRNQTTITRRNVLESLKDLGTGAGVQTTDLLKNTSEDFFRELFGLSKAEPNRSGELVPGEDLQISEVLKGKEEENKKLRSQISLERRLSDEEKRITQEKSSQLRIELQAIMNEIEKVGQSMENLAVATEVSMISTPAEPGVYHIHFFTSFLEFLQSFRKRIDLAVTWMQATNKRAEKKNYWTMYKKKGSSFLLSPDHYLTRSAG